MSFKKAKVIGANISAERYLSNIHEDGTPIQRGDPEYSLSGGDLKEIQHCPHRWLSGYRSKDTDSTDWGRIMDSLVEGTFKRKYVTAPATYTSAGKKKSDPDVDKKWNWNATVCKEWREEQAALGLTPITADEAMEANAAFKTLMTDPDIKDLIECSQKQVMVIGDYHDAETGLVVTVRCLIDLLPDKDKPILGKTIADFKTCAIATPWLWATFVDRYWYDAQAARSLDLYIAATGEDRVDWLHAIQENYPPYETGKRLISSTFVELGRQKYLQALRLYCRCLSTRTWPGYDDADWMLVEPSEKMQLNAFRQLPPMEAMPEEPEQPEGFDVGH